MTLVRLVNLKTELKTTLRILADLPSKSKVWKFYNERIFATRELTHIRGTGCHLVMGPGKIFLTWVRSIFCGLGRVGSAIYGLGYFP